MTVSAHRLVDRFRSRRSDAARDTGQALVVVLVISSISVAAAGIAIQASVVSGTATASFANAVQSRLAAETGINATLARITTAANPSGLLQTLSYVSSTWSYTTTSTFATTTGAALTTFPLSVWPATTEITSVGTMKGVSIKMTEDANITAPSSSTTTLLPAFNYAVFTPGQIGINSSASIAEGTSG